MGEKKNRPSFIVIFGGGFIALCVLSIPIMWIIGALKDEPVAEAPSVVAAPPAPSALRGVVISVAQVNEGSIDLCMDMSLREKPGQGWPFGYEEQQRTNARTAAEGNPNHMVVSADCDSQFHDRTVWARCALPEEDSELNPHRTQVTIAYYSWAMVFESDNGQVDCLQREGQWEAVERGSSDWRAGRRENAMRDLNEATDRARR